jgi:hypothetical protein
VSWKVKEYSGTFYELPWEPYKEIIRSDISIKSLKRKT